MLLGRRILCCKKRIEPVTLTADDFTAIADPGSWAVHNDLIFFGRVLIGSSASTPFDGFSGPAWGINGAYSRASAGAVAFPGGTIASMGSGGRNFYTLPADKIRVTPMLIEAYGGDEAQRAITVTDTQVITPSVTYIRQSPYSAILSIGRIAGDSANSLVDPVFQLSTGLCTFVNQYITWHYSQYVGYYLLVEF